MVGFKQPLKLKIRLVIKRNSIKVTQAYTSFIKDIAGGIEGK